LRLWFCHGSVEMHAGAVQGVLATVARALSRALVAVSAHGAGLFKAAMRGCILQAVYFCGGEWIDVVPKHCDGCSKRRVCAVVSE